MLSELPGGASKIVYIPNEGSGVGQDGVMVKFLPRSGDNNPASFMHVKSCPAIHVVPIPSRNLMLFHDYTEIVAYDENGLFWETARISWDGIEIDEVSDTAILGKSWDAPNEQHVQFSVDLTDGSHQGGSSPTS